jgi:Rps23 Pro-64 3,4-dihydroxylase Tpa1-like proline 4-hydroxylase
MLLIDNDVLDIRHLSSRRLRDRYRDAFHAARPFKHLVIDELFSETILDGIVGEFQDVHLFDWVEYDRADQVKRGTLPNARLGRASQAYINAIHSGAFIDFLSYVTGIKGLVPDPALNSGGLHEIPNGGKFALHVDVNKHSLTGLDNRLAFMTYLNRGWHKSYGGALELWSDELQRCEVEIAPVFGRSVLLYNSPVSWHGHPIPVNTPDGRPRRSIAAFYYTNGNEDTAATAAKPRFKPRPMVRTRRGQAAALLRSLLPPIFIYAVRHYRQRRSVA